MTVFMRAIPGLLALAELLASSLASRKGWINKAIVRFMLAFVGVLYRVHEPLVLSLTGAGVPEKNDGA